MPDWKAQRNRCMVPCPSADTHEWLRAGPVITLGELFLLLGDDYTAKDIDAFYRACRLVSLKRPKDSARVATATGSAGLLGVGASAIRAEAFKNRDALRAGVH